MVVAVSRREAVLHLLVMLAAACIPPASAGKNNKLCLHPHHNKCPREALQKTKPLTSLVFVLVLVFIIGICTLLKCYLLGNAEVKGQNVR